MQPVFDKADRDYAAHLFESIRAISAGRVGVTRPSYSDIETATLRRIEEAAKAAGLATHCDPAANLVVEIPGVVSDKAPCWIGSHVDSVPEGGNYDGLAGVVAGLLCLIKAKSSGVALPRPVAVLGLRGEESAWFGKPYLGSYALFGKLTARDLERTHRDTGQPLAKYLENVGASVDRIAAEEALVSAQNIGAYLELHIEQGPIMVSRKVPIGVVTGIRGNMRHPKAKCVGVSGHSGAVPRWLRNDAVFGYADLLMRLDENWEALNSRAVDLVVTSGIASTDARYHSVSRIPGELQFSLEFRSQSEETLEAFHELMLIESSRIEKVRGVKFDFGECVLSKPGLIDREWAARLRKVAAAMRYPYIDIASGAGHDAAVFARQGVPAGMIFIRNDNGSHNPNEKMDLDDFMVGTEVLYHAITLEPENLR